MASAFSSEVGTGSHSNQVYADCADLSAVENASKQKTGAPFRFNRNGKGSRASGGYNPLLSISLNRATAPLPLG